MFGEHLLLEHPGMPIALVESEKTAVICSGLMHQYLWLATGGKSCINDRLLVLQGRKIIAFPDIDGFKEWTEKLGMDREAGQVPAAGHHRQPHPVAERNGGRPGCSHRHRRLAHPLQAAPAGGTGQETLRRLPESRKVYLARVPRGTGGAHRGP